MPAQPSTLRKEERLYSKKTIDALFKGGRSHSLSAFPMRVVYMRLEADGKEVATGQQETASGQQPTSSRPLSKMLISVPKRCFKHAVKRNRVKRQVREAYRKHKALVAGYPVALAFIWLDNELRTTGEVEGKVINLLRRVSERLQKEENR